MEKVGKGKVCKVGKCGADAAPDDTMCKTHRDRQRQYQANYLKSKVKTPKKSRRPVAVAARWRKVLDNPDWRQQMLDELTIREESLTVELKRVQRAKAAVAEL